jgi:hypothetical protein
MLLSTHQPTLRSLPTPWSYVHAAGLFDSWQACLHRAVNVEPAKPKHQHQQQQQQIRADFLSSVSRLWCQLLEAWQPVVLLSTEKVAPVLLRTVLPALEFGTHCMQHATHHQHAAPARDASSRSSRRLSSSSSSSSNSRSSSSSSGSVHSKLVAAGVALHHSVLATLFKMMEDVTRDLWGSIGYGNMFDAVVEAAALHQVVAACSVMQQQLHAAAQPSAQQQRGHLQGSDGVAGSSSSSSSSSSGRHAAASIPAFHEPLLPLLPGGQAFVEAVAETTGAVIADGAGPSAQLQLFQWCNVGAFLLCMISMRRCYSSACGSGRIQPPPVPLGVYLQLLLERQLRAAAGGAAAVQLRWQAA